MTTFKVTGGGGSFEKHCLKHESRHTAVIMEVQDIKTMPDFDNPSTGVDKIPVLFDVGGKELMMFAANKVTKGGGSYSNSKLFDIMERAGIIDNFAEIFKEGDVEDNDVLEFLRGRIVGRTCEVEIKNSNRNKPDKEEYSSVGKIIEFLDQKGTTATPTEPPAPDKQTSSPAPDATPDASEKVANAEKTKETTETKK